VTKNFVSLSKDADNGNPPTVGYLVRYLCDHLMKDSRKELFVLDGAVYVNVRGRSLFFITDVGIQAAPVF
jgi:hypothetical protein